MSTFAIIVALVVALCVPAVAFAALAPSPVFAPAEPIETARSAMQSKVDPAPAPEAPAEEAPAPQAQPDGSSAYGYHHPEGRFGTCGGYVDADGDGLCDTCGAASRACPNYVADNGSGACGSYGGSCPRGAGACSGYADADGDGICLTAWATARTVPATLMPTATASATATRAAPPAAVITATVTAAVTGACASRP